MESANSQFKLWHKKLVTSRVPFHDLWQSILRWKELGFKPYSSLDDRKKLIVDDFANSFKTPTFFDDKDLSPPLYNLLDTKAIEPILIDKKVVILIDRYTSNSAKVYASILRQLQNVTIIGESSKDDIYDKKLIFKIVPKSGKREFVQFLELSPNVIISNKGMQYTILKPDIYSSYTLNDRLGLDDSMYKKGKSFIENIK